MGIHHFWREHPPPTPLLGDGFVNPGSTSVVYFFSASCTGNLSLLEVGVYFSKAKKRMED